MMYQLSPSMLSADFNRLGEQLATLDNAGCEWLHIDVMDGAFVPSISFGMPVVKSIRKQSKLFFDVHMMVEDPGRYVNDMKDCGAQMLTVHAEACTHLDRVLQSIHEAGMKSGVALNPATPLSVLDYVLDKTDSRYRDFKAFKDKKVIYCNLSERPFYELSPVEPDVVLADLIKAFHPQLLPDHQPVFYDVLK